MDTTYKVKIYKIEPRRNAAGKVISYRVRWLVDGDVWQDTFKGHTSADSFRSDLVSAQRKGEAFDTSTGRPVSMKRSGPPEMSWFDLTVKYVDMKWPDLAATGRQTLADALIRVMPVFLPTGKKVTGCQGDPLRPEAVGVQHQAPHRGSRARRRPEDP